MVLSAPAQGSIYARSVALSALGRAVRTLVGNKGV